MRSQYNSLSVPIAGKESSPSVFILDIGTCTIKAGLHTSHAPRLTPSVVGKPKYPRCLPGPSSDVTSSSDGLVLGQVARRQRGLLRLSYPVQNGGVIVDWESMRPLLRQSVQDALSDDKTEVVYSLVECPFASRLQRARLAELLFENSESCTRVGPRGAGLFCGIGPLLALFATGQTTGLVVDVGDGSISTAAAVDGYVLPLCLQHNVSGASGAAMSSYLTRILYQSGVLGPVASAMANSSASSPPSFTTVGTGQERELVYDIKEACCSVSTTPLVSSHTFTGATSATTPTVAELNAALFNAARQAQQLSEENTTDSRTYALPDGQTIELGAVEAKQAAEVLFYPSLVGLEGPGVVDAILSAIAAAPAEVQLRLLGNIVLTGGVTCCPGFGKRTFRELQQRVDTAGIMSSLRGQRVCVTAPAQRAHAGWLGASFVAQLSTFTSDMVVSRLMYEEEGEAALAKRVLT